VLWAIPEAKGSTTTAKIQNAAPSPSLGKAESDLVDGCCNLFHRSPLLPCPTGQIFSTDTKLTAAMVKTVSKKLELRKYAIFNDRRAGVIPEEKQQLLAVPG